MKKGLASEIVLPGVSSASFAQSSVTLYEIVDTGMELVTHANVAGDSVVRMPGITAVFWRGMTGSRHSVRSRPSE